MPPTTPTVLSIEAMKGRHVTGREGDDLGKIQEVMIDLSAGRVAYAVMSFGGFLGIGARMVAVPWGALHASNRPDEYMADLSKDLLREAPTYGKDKWPGGADRSFLSSLYAYYGYEPYWEAGEEEAGFTAVNRPAIATIVETTITETQTVEYGALGEVGGVGGEDLSAGLGAAEAYDERRGASESDLSDVLSDTDMTKESWHGSEPEDFSAYRTSEPPRAESGEGARGFEDVDPSSEVAFGTTSGGADLYSDTLGSNEPLNSDFPTPDDIPEGQGNNAPEDMSIGSVDDLNTIGSTLGLEGESFEDDLPMELPGEGSRRGSSAAGDLRKNDEDISEDDIGSIRSSRGHSSGQPPSTQEEPSSEEEEDEKR